MRWIIALGLLLSLNVSATPFDDGLALLSEGSVAKTEQAVELILSSKDPRASDVLKQLLNGDIYRHKKTAVLVTVSARDGSTWTLTPLFGGDTFDANKRKVKRVGINNSIRSQISEGLARLNLSHSDADKRYAAVTELLGPLSAGNRALLSQLLTEEPSSKVQAQIELALAIDTLYQAEHNTRATLKQNFTTLSGSLQPAAKAALLQFIGHSDDAGLKKYAQKAVDRIEEKAKWSAHAETLFFGLSLGSVLVLAAIGLAITFGVMGVINMAHGELIMLGAYTTYVVQQLMPNHIGLSILVAIPAAFVVSGLVGIAIERGVIRFLYGRPLETLLATFGISLVLQQAVRSIFSPLNRTVQTPDWMSGSIVLNPVLSLTLNRLYIILFCLLVFAALFYLLRKSRLGLQVRAVSQNRAMARAMGVRSERVDALTFGLGSGIAGVAGVALSQLTNVGPNLGQSYIIDSFMVVVFGGVGNLWGTLVAGMSLGVANKLIEPTAGAVLAKILVLLFIILFIQKRPQGLFPQKGRTAEG